jgi:hypothetical protein
MDVLMQVGWFAFAAGSGQGSRLAVTPAKGDKDRRGGHLGSGHEGGLEEGTWMICVCRIWA